MADADDHLNEIASSIPPLNPEVLTRKHSALLAQLLMEEVDLEPTPDGSHDHTAFSMGASHGHTGKVLGAKPSPNTMPIFEHHVQNLQHVLWAEAEGFERRTRVDLLKRISRTLI